MKKLLSIILACAMVMSLLCVVPVSAAEAVVYSSAKLPYFFSDFENGVTALPGKPIVEDDERGDVACISTVDEEVTDVEIASNAYEECHIAYNFEEGDYVTASFWLRLSEPLSQKNESLPSTIRILLWSEGTHVSLYCHIPDPTSTEWQYVSAATCFSEAFELQKINFRTGANKNNVTAEDGTTDVSYYIDNLEIKVEKGTYEKSWTGATPDGGHNYYQADYLQIGTATIEGPSGLDVTVRQYQGKELEKGNPNQLYQGGSGGQMATLAAGDEARVTMWFHNDKAFAEQAYYILKVGAKNFYFELPMEAGWHRIDKTIVTDVAAAGQIYHNFGATTFDVKDVVLADDGTYPVMSVFDYQIYFKRPDRAELATRRSYDSDAVIFDNETVLNGNSGEGVAEVDGPEGEAVTASVIQFNGSDVTAYNSIDGSKYDPLGRVNVIVDELMTVSMWVKLSAPTTADTANYVIAPASNTAYQYVIPFDGKSTEWQKLEATFVVGASANDVLYHGFSELANYHATNTKNTLKCEDGSTPEIMVYDWNLSLSTPTESASAYPIATAIAARMTASKIIPEYTIISKAMTNIENARAVFKIIGVDTGKSYGTGDSEIAVPAVEVYDEDIVLEITPVSSSFIGKPVTVEISDYTEFDGVEILYGDETSALISTTEDLDNARVIWVGYADDGSGYYQMTGMNSVIVNKNAFTEFEVTNTEDLGDWSYVRIFLWKNYRKSAAPISDYYEY